MKFFNTHISHPTLVKRWSREWIMLQWAQLELWKKCVSCIVLGALLISYFPIQAYFSRGAEYVPVAQSLYSQKIIDTEYSRADLLDIIPREEAIRIAINIGGGLDFECFGSRFLSPNIENTFDCKYQEFAQKKGIIQGKYDPYASISRSEAVRSLVIAAGLSPSSSEAPYIDIAGEVGYIARAYEIGCTDQGTAFRPTDAISRGEILKLSECIHTVALGSSGNTTLYTPAPSPISTTSSSGKESTLPILPPASTNLPLLTGSQVAENISDS